jgi:hypothetical protein
VVRLYMEASPQAHWLGEEGLSEPNRSDEQEMWQVEVACISETSARQPGSTRFTNPKTKSASMLNYGERLKSFRNKHLCWESSH